MGPDYIAKDSGQLDEDHVSEMHYANCGDAMPGDRTIFWNAIEEAGPAEILEHSLLPSIHPNSPTCLRGPLPGHFN